MALIDRFRSAPADQYRGGYLWVLAGLVFFAVLAAVLPPPAETTGRDAVVLRLMVGLPAFALALLPGTDRGRAFLKRHWHVTRGPVAVALTGLALLLLHAWLSGHWAGPWRYAHAALLLGLPYPVLRLLARRSRIAAGWAGQLLFIFLLLKPPLDVSVIRPSGNLVLDVNLWFLLCLASAAVLFEHHLGLDVRYTWKMRGSDFWWIGAGALALVLIVVLPAYALGFSNLILRKRGFLALAACFLGKVWFVGLSQELVFRGVAIASLPTEGPWWTGGRGTVVVVVLTSLWFGVTHYLIGGWTYVTLAFLAGLVYALVYLGTGRLAPGMVLHGALDTAKFLFFG